MTLLIQHELYIKRCLDLARLGRGKVAPNPIVGAVIVHKGKIIGEGYHKQVGGNHAEIEAIHRVKDTSLLSKATIYVSLEPCFHYGRTPPCVDSLLQYGFREVVICQVDPYDKVKGKSIDKLKANGVQVEVGYLEKEGSYRNAYFICRIQRKRPYVILKYAKTAKGILGYKNQQFWISNAYTKRLVHRWRSEVGAILVGTNTAMSDNPRLNNRLYFGNSPIRVLLDRQLSIDKTSYLLNDGLPTIVITEVPIVSASTAVTYHQIPFDNQLLPSVLDILFKRDIDSLLVEGGAYTLQQFIENNLWDEARVITNYHPISPPKGAAVIAPSLPNPSSRTFQLQDDLLEVFFND